MKTLHIEIRKVEPVFRVSGKDRWEVRFGDIAGSTDMHNISKTNLLKVIKDEIDELK